MGKGVAVFFALVLLIPSAYSMSVKELIAKYAFSFSSDAVSILNYTDYMADKDSNGLNDTLIIELTVNGNGNFIFVVNVMDDNRILANETSATFSGGARKLNMTFRSFSLSQERFNYSIKIYNSTNNLKYRRDNIPTNAYTNYEKGFNLLETRDSKAGNKLIINISINSSLNGTFQPTLFLGYNSSLIHSRQDSQITKGQNDLLFELDNKTIKSTHYIGRYNISSLRIGGEAIKINYATSAYDFREFAASSYVYGFADGKLDSDADNKYDSLRINISVYSFRSGTHNLKLSLHDLFGNILEIKNISASLGPGNHTIHADINGTRIYNKRLNGPFAVRNIELYENNTLVDRINDAHITSNYNFNDFSPLSLPDIRAAVSVSDGYHYGANNITINITFRNIGNKPAFNLFFDVFDNGTFSRANKSNMLMPGSGIFYQLNFTSASDFEISAIADFQGLIDESNESNNAERILIKINKKPVIVPIANITVNETDKIIINLSASDPNGDKLLFSVNLSKFSSESSLFRWHTTTTDSGNYTLMAVASDAYLNDSAVFSIIVLDAPDKDSDNDGINDTVDRVIGNEASINTSTMDLRLRINNSNNLSRLFEHQTSVTILDGNLTIAEFEFNFSGYRLNLTNMTIEKQTSNSTGFLVFKGLRMPVGFTKTLYLDNLNTGAKGVCVKDEEISSISEISGDCSSNNEFKIECDGTLQNSYRCSYNSSLGKYRIDGLKHSGIIQFNYVKSGSQSSSSASSSTGSSSGGGGGVACASDWECSKWSECADGARSRKCLDANYCAFAMNKPLETENCNSGNYEKGSEYFKDKEILSKLKNSTNLAMKSSKELAKITGRAVQDAAGKKISPILVMALGIMILFAGYYFVSKYKLK